MWLSILRLYCGKSEYFYNCAKKYGICANIHDISRDKSELNLDPIFRYFLFWNIVYSVSKWNPVYRLYSVYRNSLLVHGEMNPRKEPSQGIDENMNSIGSLFRLISETHILPELPKSMGKMILEMKFSNNELFSDFCPLTRPKNHNAGGRRETNNQVSLALWWILH